MIPGSANPLLLKSAAAGGLQIERSLRFNSSDSAYLSRTPASAGNRKTWTWAGWAKRSGIGGELTLFASGTAADDSTFGQIIFSVNNTLTFNAYYTSWRSTAQVLRDPSAWYHIVVAFDTTQATASNRVKIYINGSEVTSFGSSSDPTQNADYAINQNLQHTIGRYDLGGGGNYFPGYLANIHFIDGQQLTPSSFTETDATTGQLIPKTYTGSYGTNGFNLLFADNSSNTASTLGKDTSPNGNNFTPNNFSVTAGAGNDSLVDSPTNYGADTGVGGEVRGNYATLNPLDKLSSLPLTNGNLEVGQRVAAGRAHSTIAVNSGKWYVEMTAAGDSLSGISLASAPPTNFPGGDASSYGYYQDGTKYTNNTSTSYGASYTAGDLIGIALNLDAGTLVFYKNGTSQGTAFSSLSGTFVFAARGSNTATTENWNFGQRAFAYTAPSGFKALCTQNLPEGTITTSGSFTGNANADGPFVYLNGVPTAMTINSNAVTFATHADKLSNGFKLRTSSGSYNTAGSNTYSITTTGDKFKYARAQPNP